MNLGSIDLNLLVTLDALLTEGSVTGAAHKLGLSQSATSHALGRLRELVGDPLLVRSGREMVPTPRARALAGPLRSVLDRTERLLAWGGQFDPGTSTADFVISLDEGSQLTLLPDLLERLGAVAPQVRLDVRASHPDALARQLEHGELELAVTSRPPARARGILSERLMTSPYVTIFRADHPVADRELTLERYLDLDHVAVSTPTLADADIDRWLAQRSLSRNVRARVSTMASVPRLVAATHLVATVPTLLLELVPRGGRRNMRERVPPLPLDPLSAHLVWHERTRESEAHSWLRETVTDLFSQAEPQP